MKTIKKSTVKKVEKKTKKTKKESGSLGLIIYLLRLYYQIQKYRLAFGSQVRELEKSKKDAEIMKGFFDKTHDLEKDIAKEVQAIVTTHPMYGWLEEVKGIGPIIAAALVSSIDISKAQHASSLWKYMGLAVTPEGTAERRVRGQKIQYNPFLKDVCWKIGQSFIKTKGKYRMIYDTSKLFYKKKFPKTVTDPKTKKKMYTKGHIHNMAIRRAVKLFIADFWVAWRELEGLPVSEPFAHRIVSEPVKVKTPSRKSR